MRIIRVLVAFLIFGPFWLATSLAAERVALVIGNSGYAHAPYLPNPSNDARAISAVLSEAGYDVTSEGDLSNLWMLEVLRDFAAKAAQAEIAVVYYAGHGIEVDGRNYLIPTDAKLATDQSVDFEATQLDLAVRAASGASKLALVVLDVCRDNPFGARMRTRGTSRSIGRGLAAVSPQSTGVLVAYATRPGAVAADGDGTNSPFTAAFLEAWSEPDRDVRRFFGSVQEKVLARTNGVQQPFINGSLGGGVITLKGQPATPVPVIVQPRALVSDPAKAAYDDARGRGTRAALERVGRLFPNTYWGQTAAEEAVAMTNTALVVPVPSRPSASRSYFGISASKWLSGGSGEGGSSFREGVGLPEMVVIPSGSFMMGSPEAETTRFEVPNKYASWERPQRSVRIPGRFALGRTEVTVGEWRRFVGETGHSTGGSCRIYEGGKWESRSGLGWDNPGFDQGEDHPVVCVNWNDAQAYVEWVNGKSGGSAYRLPSESEWEYSARGGTVTARYWGDDAGATEQCRYVNGHDAASKRVNGFLWQEASCDDGFAQTSPVGRYGKNGFGLSDTLGNVWEWVEDCFASDYSSASVDGSAYSPESCSQRVLRGGSWYIIPGALRSAYRFRYEPVDRFSHIGFRLARTLTP